MNDKKKERFLVVDDSSHFSFFIKRTLEERFSATVKVAWDCASARDIFSREKFDVITLDYILPDGDGLELLKEFTSEKSCPPVIMITGEGDEDIAARCLKLGASGYVAKSREFYAQLSEVVDKVRSEMSHQRVHETIEKSNVIIHAIENIRELGASEADRNAFLKGICGSLIEGQDFYNTWIAILDESGNITHSTGASSGDKYMPILDLLNEGTLPDCCKRAMGKPGILVIPVSSEECGDCPLAAVSKENGVMISRFKHGDNVYGVIGVYGPTATVEDREENELLAQVAEDTAYALSIIGLAVDKERAEEALHDILPGLQAVADSVSDAVFILNGSNRIDYWNAGAERVYGYKSDEVAGREVAGVLFAGGESEDDRDSFEIFLKKAARGVVGDRDEFVVTRKDGEKRQVNLNATTFKADGEIQIVITGHDVPEANVPSA